MTTSILVGEVDVAKKKKSNKAEGNDGVNSNPGNSGSSSQSVTIKGVDGKQVKMEVKEQTDYQECQDKEVNKIT
jgi:hypothetical protein